VQLAGDSCLCNQVRGVDLQAAEQYQSWDAEDGTVGAGTGLSAVGFLSCEQRAVGGRGRRDSRAGDRRLWRGGHKRYAGRCGTVESLRRVQSGQRWAAVVAVVCVDCWATGDRGRRAGRVSLQVGETLVAVVKRAVVLVGAAFAHGRPWR